MPEISMEQEFAARALEGMKAEYDKLRAALDDATARAEAAEKRARDMEAAVKVTLSEEALTVGFMDGLDTVIGYLQGASAEPDCPANERAIIAGVARVFEEHKKELIDTYRDDSASARTGTIRIEPV